MNRYGGNTSCVELELADGSTLIIDAGTGIRSLGVGIAQTLPKINILLTHLHLDHIQGLMFFAPASARTPRSRSGARPRPRPRWRSGSPATSPLPCPPSRSASCRARSTSGTRPSASGRSARRRSGPRRSPIAARPSATGSPTATEQRSPTSPTTSPGWVRPSSRSSRVDLGLRPRQGRRPADPRLPIHRRGVPGPRRLGPFATQRHPDVRPAGRGSAAAVLPPRPAPLRRLPRRLR